MAIYPKRILSICAGIGGLDLGVKLATGAKTVCYIEREAYSASVIVARMEDKTLAQAPIWDDLTTFDGKPWRGKVDCVIAGFPCQPWSVAGRKKGTADERWLWDDIWRIVCEVRPEYVFLENVPGLLRGGIEHVLRSMAESGYDAEWGCFSAEQCGFAHKRERLFILGKLENSIRHRPRRRGEGFEQTEIQGCGLPEDQVAGSSKQLGDAEQSGCEWNESDNAQVWEVQGKGSASKYGQIYFLPGPNDSRGWEGCRKSDETLEPALRRKAHGLPDWMVKAYEYRPDRLRALGNGVVPLVGAIAFITLFMRFEHD